MAFRNVSWIGNSLERGSSNTWIGSGNHVKVTGGRMTKSGFIIEITAGACLIKVLSCLNEPLLWLHPKVVKMKKNIRYGAFAFEQNCLIYWALRESLPILLTRNSTIFFLIVKGNFNMDWNKHCFHFCVIFLSTPITFPLLVHSAFRHNLLSITRTMCQIFQERWFERWN